jgi:hypothetical protein
VSWNLALTMLRDALANLYPTEQDSRVVVADAGLSTERISFAGAATNNWHNILVEAQRQGKVGAIIDVAREEFPKDKRLSNAAAAFDQARSEGELLPEASVPPGLGAAERRAFLEQELSQHQRNLFRLRQQKSTFANGEAPLRLLNQMDHEEQEIGRIQGELESLGDSS